MLFHHYRAENAGHGSACSMSGVALLRAHALSQQKGRVPHASRQQTGTFRCWHSIFLLVSGVLDMCLLAWWMSSEAMSMCSTACSTAWGAPAAE